jgi:glutaminase
VLLRGGKLGKLGIAGLVWAVLPRKLKLAAWGLVLGAAIVLLGSLAALALLAMQLS